MNESRTVEAFDIEIPRNEAYRLLGMHLKKREPIQSVQDNFDLAYTSAQNLIEARAVSSTNLSGIHGSSFICATAPISLVVCTIGPALEQRVAELTDGGLAAQAMLLDAIGSAAVEALADCSNQRICAEALDAGLDPGPRVSPGYGAWKLEDQAWLFGELTPADIGVTLSDHYMMMPRKSISYGVPLTGGDKQPRGRCVHCGLEDCAYRTV